MGNIFLVADLHFSHKNIIDFCLRPFPSVHKMNDTLINNWNRVVQPDDTVYVLGDFMMGNNYELAKAFLEKLNGHVNLILGNHDARIKPWDWVDAGFESVHTSLLLKDNIYLAHDPAVYNALPKGSILLCGHVHTVFTVLPDKNIVNVGVDVQNFTPITVEEALRQLQRAKMGLPAHMPSLDEPEDTILFGAEER